MRGLQLGSKILYTEPPQERPGRTLLAMVRDQPDARDALARGQLEVIAAETETYGDDWLESATARALAQGYPSVRWSAEATTAWSVMPRGRHAEVERATDELCRTQPVSVLCQYAVDDPGQQLWRMCQVHSAGLRGPRLRTVPFPGGIAIADEVDRSNEDILRAVLAAATSSSERDLFVVDLSALWFLDVGGARALLGGTAPYRAAGGRVRLLAPTAQVQIVIRLVRVDEARGVLVGEV